MDHGTPSQKDIHGAFPPSLLAPGWPLWHSGPRSSLPPLTTGFAASQQLCPRDARRTATGERDPRVVASGGLSAVCPSSLVKVLVTSLLSWAAASCSLSNSGPGYVFTAVLPRGAAPAANRLIPLTSPQGYPPLPPPSTTRTLFPLFTHSPLALSIIHSRLSTPITSSTAH